MSPHLGHTADVFDVPGGAARLVCACGGWRGELRASRLEAWADVDAWRDHITDAGIITYRGNERRKRPKAKA